MYLKKVEIFGFKSFLKGLELNLNPGIIAVVGPNGCGKSNISESIRWVLGEQNARLLRGETMEDVIFNGTRSRKPLGMAEVSLTISNDLGRLPIDFSEVKITRRVFRSGMSEYYLNKSQVRLKDIRDLFADTGMGNFSYSLIERAMVDNLIGDTSTNLRVLLEEAAGIVKYKTQERQALRKLEATEKDLFRIRDIVNEVEKRVRSLKRQESKARRFKVLSGRVRELEVLIAKEDRETLQGEHAAISSTFAAATDERERTAAEQAGLEARHEEMRAQATDGERRLAEAQASVEEVSRKLAEISRERMLLDERDRHARDRIREAEEAVTQAREGLARATEERQAKESELGAVRAQLDRSGLEGEERARALSKQDAELRGLRAEVKDRKQLTLDIVKSGSERRGELGALEGRLGELSERHNRIGAERERLAAEHARLTAERERAESERDARAADRVRLEGLRVEAASALDAAVAAAGEVVRRTSVLAERREHVEGNLKLLRDLEKRYEGFRKGARTILLEAGDGRHRGVIGDLLRMRDEGLRSALSAALGGGLESIVVEGESDSSGLLDFLRQEERGRATFLLLSRFRPGNVVAEGHPVLREPGVVGVARDAVACEAPFSAIFDFLLGRVIVVDDLAAAMRLSAREEYWDLRFVTRGGEVVHHPGIVTGGSETDGRHGFLERKGEIFERERELARILVELTDLAGEGSRAEAASESGRALLASIEAELRGARERSESLVREAEAANAALTAVNHRVGVIAREAEEVAGTLASIASEIDGRRAEHALAGEREEEAGTSLGTLEGRLHALETERENAARLLAQIQVSHAGLSARLDSLKEDIARCVRLESELTERITAKSEEARSLGERVVEMGAGRGALADQEIAEAHERERREGTRDGFVLANQELYERLADLDRRVKAGRKAKEEALERHHALEVRLGEIQTRLQGLESRVREEYGRALDELIELLPADAGAAREEPPADEESEAPGEAAVEEIVAVASGAAPTGRRAELAEVRRKIERIGAVNLVALEEYDQENSRYTFLKGQEGDLLAAKESLVETIRTVDSKARTLFVDTLGAVRENFKSTFTTLFQGGEADIILEDPTNPLESPIEIVARPGGKKLQRVALMSGGERALTAISILFALYLHKPSPFCILDEVDAPLDEANVGRFVAMLKSFSERTQFIVITHNKRTTEACDSLFGVTMEEPGVSKLVAVRLSDLGERFPFDGQAAAAAPAVATTAAETAAEPLAETPATGDDPSEVPTEGVPR